MLFKWREIDNLVVRRLTVLSRVELDPHAPAAERRHAKLMEPGAGIVITA